MVTTDPLRHPTVAACRHDPPCPTADAMDHGAARVIAAHQEQGWSLLCNGVITFDDTGELLPDGTPIQPHPGPMPPRPPAVQPAVSSATIGR